MWPWNLMDDSINNRAPLLYYIKLCVSVESRWWIQTSVTVSKHSIWVKLAIFCASFHSHWWIQTGVTVWKCPIWVKKWFCEPWDFEIWWMTMKNNRAPLLSDIKLCASFHHHMWIQTWVTVWKWLHWVMTSVTLTFDLWPWPFPPTSILSLVANP